MVFLKPYIANRFASYLHAWEYAATSGYQQTRTMIAIGSGGLLGLGGGNGNLDRVAAADTDLVFGILCEEWGLIVRCARGLSADSGGLRSAPRFWCPLGILRYRGLCGVGNAADPGRSQSVRSVDLLPLTGITFPLVSNGGSSMAASFALLAFVESVGTSGERKTN